MKDILEFQGEHRWLSNFWPAVVVLDGVRYPSVENAYQAAKFPTKDRVFFETCSAGEAKRRGRTAKIHLAWDACKADIMRSLIEQKFAKGTALGERLRATGGCRIVEGNAWGDVYWGVCRGVGENVLGRLLMMQRDALQREKP